MVRYRKGLVVQVLHLIESSLIKDCLLFFGGLTLHLYSTSHNIIPPNTHMRIRLESVNITENNSQLKHTLVRI